MQAVEPDRTGKVTRADHINLMGLIGQERRKLGILLALRCISSGSPVSQFTAMQNATNGANAGQRLNVHVLHLPLDGLTSAEEPLVVQVQSYQLDDLFDLRRCSMWANEWPP